jgi:hypothetical protein
MTLHMQNLYQTFTSDYVCPRYYVEQERKHIQFTLLEANDA